MVVVLIPYSRLERYNTDATIGTVHFGGGTPSILEERQIKRIMGYLHSLKVKDGLEVTFECAPETIADAARAWPDDGRRRLRPGEEPQVG